MEARLEEEAEIPLAVEEEILLVEVEILSVEVEILSAEVAILSKVLTLVEVEVETPSVLVEVEVVENLGGHGKLETTSPNPKLNNPHQRLRPRSLNLERRGGRS